ncbi:MAG TPA: peptide ABC transporter substrate-binding protein [Ktedonobacteraceae bacterium]|nr:peptide ABC transporter substrate-binding protein [Ktedonobacteraceae bacterium]
MNLGKGSYLRLRWLPIFLCLMCLLLVGCSLGGNNPGPGVKTLEKAPADKQVYRVPQVGITDITTLDPALVLAADQPAMNAIEMIYSGLMELNDKLQVQPQLAQSWNVSQDGLSYTFHLRHNLKFSDGTPLSSTDVAYSIDRALQPTTKSTVAPIYLALIKDSDKLVGGFIPTLINDSLLTPDANTLVITIKKKAPYFLSMLTYPCSFVVEKHLIDTYKSAFTDHLAEGGSTGPFKVSQYTHGKEIDFVPNSNYYGPQPQLHKVVFPFYPQSNNAYHDYLTGQVDTTGVPVSTFASDKKRSDFHQIPQLWINYYTMNYLVKPFDNVHIRQAFALAIDKAAIVNDVWKGTVLATNHIVPQGMPGYNPNLTGPDGTQSLKGNPAQAKALLQMGMKEENVTVLPPIKLTYATSTSFAYFDQEVTAMIKAWHDVLGVTVIANAIDYNTLLTQVTLATGNAAGLQFWGLTWVAEYPDPQDWLTRQFDSGVPNNNMNYGQNTSSNVAKQQDLQRQLENADSDSRESVRYKTYQEGEQQLVNDVAWMPMEQVTAAFLRKSTVIGIVDNAQGIIPPNDWANVYIGQYV